MTRLMRPVLGLVMFAGLVAPTRAAEVDPILPAESEQVLFINVRQILDSDLVKKFAFGQLSQALKGNESQKFLEKIGLDPLKDIDSVTAGSWGKTAGEDKSVIVLRGRFDAEKLFAAADAEAKKNPDRISITQEGEVKVMKFVPEVDFDASAMRPNLQLNNLTEDDKKKPPFYATVAGPEAIVVATDLKLVLAAREAARTKDLKPAVKPEVAKLVAAQDEKASVFMCGLVTQKVEIPPGVDLSIANVQTADLNKQLEKLATVAIALRLTSDVGLEIGMGMKDADAADDFGKTVERLLTTAKTFLPLATNQRPAFKPIADDVGKSLKSTVKEKDVTVSVKLTGDGIGQVAGGDDR